MMGNKHGLDPAHMVEGKYMATVLGASLKWEQLGTLTPIISCEYVGTQQHVLGYVPSDQVCVWLSVFLEVQWLVPKF